MPPPGQQQRTESKFIVFEHFEKMNTQSVRQALSEKELAWLENLQPIAPNNLALVPGPAQPALSNISEVIKYQYYANIGAIDYIISFTTAGSGWATNTATGVSTRFAPPATFTNPDMTVWESQYALINDPTAGYCFWNGTVFSKQGGVSPNLVLTAGGSGYTSIPIVDIFGGSGSGVTATATIGTPQVSGIAIVSGGSQYGPAPTIGFSGGGGSGAAATAVIDPRGVLTITVSAGGAYTSTPGVVFSGTGSGAAATAVMGPSGLPLTPLKVVSITITAPGSNYTSPPSISFSGGGGLGGAAATCTVGNGAVINIIVTNPGSGYTSPPAVAFSGGGSGSGAVAQAYIGGGQVTSLILLTPGNGYLPSDVLSVSISGGGGTGATGTAHVSPFATPGTTIAVFGGRVWLGGARLIQFTGTQGFDDFSNSNGAGGFTISDSDLTHSVTALRNYNNYLYIVGDQSIKQIGNISISGSTTLFTVLTLSSDQGSIYPHSCGSFNRVFMFANSNGIYAVFGSAVQKISDDMDGIFKLIDFSQPPQYAIADINGIHNIMWLVRYQDPVQAITRSIMLTFTGKKWWINSLTTGLVSIVSTSNVASGKNITYCSSGQDITQMFANTAFSMTYRLQTALSHHGNAVQRKKIMNGGVAVTAQGSPVMTVNYDTENNTNAISYTLGNGFTLPSGADGAEGSGRYLGMTLTGSATAASFTISNCALEYQETALWK